MAGQPGLSRPMTCPPFEGVVQMLLSQRYTRTLDEYSSLLDEDPDYLTHHSTATALKLQFEIKLNDLPSLKIGECLDQCSVECCIVDALREALKRRSSPEYAE